MVLYLIPLACLVVGYNLWQVFTEEPPGGVQGSPQAESNLDQG